MVITACWVLKLRVCTVLVIKRHSNIVHVHVTLTWADSAPIFFLFCIADSFFLWSCPASDDTLWPVSLLLLLEFSSADASLISWRAALLRPPKRGLFNRGELSCIESTSSLTGLVLLLKTGKTSSVNYLLVKAKSLCEFLQSCIYTCTSIPSSKGN